MQMIELIIGSILLLLLIIKGIKGSSYEEYVEDLSDNDYPMKFLYAVGFGWNCGKLLTLKGKIKAELIGQAKLLYDPNYSEYYAMVTWAQTLSFVHILLCAGFIIAGVTDTLLFAMIGLICAAVFGYYFLTRMKEKLEARRMECVVELPEIVSTMALLINSGMVLREAWSVIADSKDGEIYSLMKSVNNEMKNGMSDVDAISKFGILSNTPEIKKFSSALVQGLEKGSKDLSEFLIKQSSEMWLLKKQIMLQKGEAAATKLLMPTVMIFLGIIIVVMTGAIGMMF